MEYKDKFGKTVNIGDFVMVATHKKHIHKLELRWKGPFQIVDTISDFVFNVRLLGDTRGYAGASSC